MGNLRPPAANWTPILFSSWFPPSELTSSDPSTQVKMKKRDTPLCKQQSTPCYGKGESVVDEGRPYVRRVRGRDCCYFCHLPQDHAHSRPACFDGAREKQNQVELNVQSRDSVSDKRICQRSVGFLLESHAACSRSVPVTRLHSVSCLETETPPRKNCKSCIYSLPSSFQICLQVRRRHNYLLILLLIIIIISHNIIITSQFPWRNLGSNVSATLATFLTHERQPAIVTCRCEISPACCRGRPGFPKIEGEGNSRRQQQAAAASCLQPPELIKQRQQKLRAASRSSRAARDTQERFREGRQEVCVCVCV